MGTPDLRNFYTSSANCETAWPFFYKFTLPNTTGAWQSIGAVGGGFTSGSFYVLVTSLSCTSSSQTYSLGVGGASYGIYFHMNGNSLNMIVPGAYSMYKGYAACIMGWMIHQ